MGHFDIILGVFVSLSILQTVLPLPTNIANKRSNGRNNGIASSTSFQDYLKSRNSTLRNYMRARSPPASDMVEINDFISTAEIPRPLGMFGTKPLSDEEREKITNENNAIKFMKQFGYIPQGGDTSDYLITASGFQDTIKKVQTFGNIPVTGELDQKTIQLMSSPRCGVPDIAESSIEGGPSGGLSTVERSGNVVHRVNSSTHSRPKRFIVGGSGWNKRQISYHIENYSSKLHNMTNVETELRKAFDVWSSYARLNFTLTADRNADIIIYFAEYDHYDGYPFDGQGGTLAHAYYPREFGHYGGDIHFDESEQWTINPTEENSGLDFFTVAVHEIGHSLGLAHSPVRTSIMFPYYKGSESKETFALDYDDILGMYELYIQRQLPGDDKYFNQNHDGTSTESTTQASRITTTTTVRPTEEDDHHNDEDYQTEEERRRQGESDKNSHITNSDENDSSNTGGSGTNTNNDNTNTNISSTNVDKTNASNATILYHGDSMTVDEYLSKRDFTTPKIPIFYPVDEEEQRRKWDEEEEKRKEEERKWYEEEAIRREEAAKKREEERRKYEEETKRKEEEARREYEANLERREQERKNEIERRRKLEEERIKRQEEERMKAYEEEIRRYEEELRKNREANNNNNKKNNSSDAPTVGDVICDGNIDSAAKIRDDIFMFKGESMWRFAERREMRPGYPAPIRALFSGLPEWTNRIDAAYERQNDSVIIFFIGNSFYEHRVNQVTPSIARPLSDLGLPPSVTQLDAVLFWPKNNKVYFFRHSEYWRYDEATGAIEAGYPQPMDRWYGIPSYLDAAVTLTTTSSYFFKGDQFFEFDNQQVVSVPGYPKRTQDYWFSHC